MMHSSGTTPASALRTAFVLAREGRLDDAEALCAAILRRQADHAEALLLKAVIETQRGHPAEAAAFARRSIERDGSRAGVHALLGDALLASNRPEEALASYEAALRLSPMLVSARFGRANALLDLERPAEAVRGYDAVLASQPNDAEAHFNRGNALFRMNEPSAAVESFDRAIAARPAYPAALSNRGSALLLLERAEEALASFDAALALAPDLAEALYHRGCALRLLGRLQDAREAFERALQARPEHRQALIACGEAARELGRPDRALESFERALALEPDCVAALRGRGDALLDLGRASEALAAHEAALGFTSERAATLNSRGNSLRALERFAESAAAYDESLRLDASSPTAHYNRSTLLLRLEDRVDEALAGYARVLELDPDYPNAAGALLHAQRNRADWSLIAPAASRERVIQSVLDGKPAAAPFAFLSISDSAAAQLRCATTFATRLGGHAGARPDKARRRHERIRIAYVSPDLREHAVSYLMAGVLERHDAQRFEIIGISLKAGDASSTAGRVKAAFSRFFDVSKHTDGEVADLMRELELDIAVDLCGYTEGFRPQIFMRRAAPVQVNYLGYPGTMGAPFMDYLIADSFVIPPDKRSHYREQIAYLPHSFQANDRRAIDDRSASRAVQGLPDGAFVFCCLNNSHKINPAMFDIWMSLLAQLPDSVLWLLGDDAAVRDNLSLEARSRGIDPARLVFAAREPYAQHLGRLELADLFLDTLPFNGGATASDALWAGVPLLTCAGDAFAARMAGSVLRAAGVPELVAFSLPQYESRALELACRPQELGALRERLSARRFSSPLFDQELFCRHLERAYTEMWLRHESGQEPSSFVVPPREGP